MGLPNFLLEVADGGRRDVDGCHRQTSSLDSTPWGVNSACWLLRSAFPSPCRILSTQLAAPLLSHCAVVDICHFFLRAYTLASFPIVLPYALPKPTLRLLWLS